MNRLDQLRIAVIARDIKVADVPDRGHVEITLTRTHHSEAASVGGLFILSLLPAGLLHLKGVDIANQCDDPASRKRLQVF